MCRGLTSTQAAWMIDLKSKQSLSVLLLAIAKKSGGEVRLSEEDMAKVTTLDSLALYWDAKEEQVVLKSVDASEFLTQETTKYEN